MNNDDLGKDLRNVQALQRKHEGLERDLAALGDKINQLDEKASKLTHLHKDSAEVIYEKQKEINEEWTHLCAKANMRKVKLLDSYDLQKFLSDYRDLMSWVGSMKSLICTDELATDVTGAEALIERHNEHRTEIDARTNTFQVRTSKILVYCPDMPRLFCMLYYFHIRQLRLLAESYDFNVVFFKEHSKIDTDIFFPLQLLFP